jgi:hypothetical protein
MAYHQGAAVSVISAGRPVREINKDGKRVSIIPFDSEYKIRLINKKNVRCKVEVFIDGTDVLFGQKIVLYPGQTMDLERFLTDKHDGNKFKFISKGKAMQTGEILDPDSADNGRVQVNFYEECFSATSWITLTNQTYQGSICGGGMVNGVASSSIGAINCNVSGTSTGVASGSTFTSTVAPQTKSLNEGVTAEGGRSNQQFHSAQDFNTNYYPFATIDIWLSGPLVEKQKSLVVPKSLSAEFVSEAQTKIALGLSAHATKEQRAIAADYLAILSSNVA